MLKLLNLAVTFNYGDTYMFLSSQLEELEFPL